MWVSAGAVCVCTCACVCMHTSLCTCTRVPVYMHARVCMHVCVHVHTVALCARVPVCVRTRVCPRLQPTLTRGRGQQWCRRPPCPDASGRPTRSAQAGSAAPLCWACPGHVTPTALPLAPSCSSCHVLFSGINHLSPCAELRLCVPGSGNRHARASRQAPPPRAAWWERAVRWG